MNLPEGTLLGVSSNPLQEEHTEEKALLTGRVEVITEEGTGFLLVDGGRVVAAYYRDSVHELSGKDVVNFLVEHFSTSESTSIKYVQYRYNAEEMAEAIGLSQENGLLTGGREKPAPSGLETLDNAMLERLMSQPGVRAVSIFFEGFPVHSLGDVDFDQVAAMAEDFLRSGRKVSADMGMGVLDQIILEGVERKFIIAPYGDLYLCLLTDSDANIGLIRLAIKNIQSELK